MTGVSDGCGGEALHFVRWEALRKHPRGAIHVSAMSQTGRKVVWSFLHYVINPSRDDDPRGHSRTQAAFRAYCTRIASDPKDPLSREARLLLETPRQPEATRRGEFTNALGKPVAKGHRATHEAIYVDIDKGWNCRAIVPRPLTGENLQEAVWICGQEQS